MIRCVGYICLLTVVFSSTAIAKGSGHEASSKGIYKPTDPHRALKEKIETFMGVYLVHPPRRHVSERVSRKGKQIRIALWHPVGETSDVEIITRAVKWLVFGRTQYASGARGIFSEFPEIQKVTLIFHEVLRSKRKSRRRKKVRERIKRYLSLSLSRRTFEKLQVDALKECVERLDCQGAFQQLFDRRSFDRAFVKKARQDK